MKYIARTYWSCLQELVYSLDTYIAPGLVLTFYLTPERPSAAKAIPLTADEQALKRAEMARRRKNLTDQRLEEEKVGYIPQLIPRAPHPTNPP